MLKWWSYLPNNPAWFPGTNVPFWSSPGPCLHCQSSFLQGPQQENDFKSSRGNSSSSEERAVFSTKQCTSNSDIIQHTSRPGALTTSGSDTDLLPLPTLNPAFYFPNISVALQPGPTTSKLQFAEDQSPDMQSWLMWETEAAGFCQTKLFASIEPQISFDFLLLHGMVNVFAAILFGEEHEVGKEGLRHFMLAERCGRRWSKGKS